MILYFVSIYLAGMTFIPYNFKVAAGKFDEDKWVAFVQAVVNIIVSILAIKTIGLPGVFVGTIVSRMIVVIVRPQIVFKYVLNKNPLHYYIRLTYRTILALLIAYLMWVIKNSIFVDGSIGNFILLCVLTLIIPNLIFLIVFGKSENFKDIISRVTRR